MPFFTTAGPINFEVYDTAGQEMFGGLREAHYVDSKACFLFFDVTSRETYQNVESWYTDVYNICQDIPYVLIGNKCDVTQREVRTQAVTWHRKRQIKYVEISAKSNYNYTAPFLIICQKLAGDDTLKFVQQPVLVPAEINMSEHQIKLIQDAQAAAENAPLPDDE